MRCMLANLLGCSGLSGCQSSTTGELGQICPSGTSDGPEEPARLGANLDLSSPLLRKIQISARANGWCISQQPRDVSGNKSSGVTVGQKHPRVCVCVCGASVTRLTSARKTRPCEMRLIGSGC